VDWLAAPDYWLTRFVFERALGAIYLVAFLVTVNQFRPLLGERGLLPAPDFIHAVPFRASPTLFHLIGYSDRKLLVVGWAGVVLSVLAITGWRDLTCLYYHHETQPMPNPLSWYFHHLPKRLHRMEVLGNHVAQLVVPWFLFFPQPIATVAGIVIVGTQSWLVLSGNFAWLNFLTIALAISAFDNAALGRILPLTPYGPQTTPGWYLAIVLAVTALIVFLSYRPARNLLSRRQIMNASFDPFHIVGTYGAFGSVTKERYEVVIEGTADPVLTPETVWREYEFKGKPTDVRRLPPQVAPYDLRLDWLMWFAAMSSPMYL